MSDLSERLKRAQPVIPPAPPEWLSEAFPDGSRGGQRTRKRAGIVLGGVILAALAGSARWAGTESSDRFWSEQLFDRGQALALWMEQRQEATKR